LICRCLQRNRLAPRALITFCVVPHLLCGSQSAKRHHNKAASPHGVRPQSPRDVDRNREREGFAPRLGPFPSSEQGYALVAAVAAVVLFAGVALALVQLTRARQTEVAADIAHARAEAAAQAGFAMALHGLVARDEASLVALDGRTRAIDLDGARIDVRLIDERGKVAASQLQDEATVGRLLRMAGLEGNDLDVARDSLLDWMDGDDDARANGAEAAFYAPQGIAPRNGPLASVDELARVRGFSPRLVARLRPILSVEPDAVPFEPGHADPAAIAVMSESGADSPSVIARARELSGDQTALTFTDPRTVLRRPITIALDVSVPGGGHVHHEGVVVVTGVAARPYEIRNWR